MITNAQNNAIVVQAYSGGHVMLNLFKSVSDYNEYMNPTPIATPEPIEGEEPTQSEPPKPITKQDIPLYIGNRLEVAKQNITSLDGMTLVELETKILEQIIIDVLIEEDLTFRLYSNDGTDLRII